MNILPGFWYCCTFLSVALILKCIWSGLPRRSLVFFLLHCYCCCLWWLTHPQGYPCMCKADFWMPDETFNHTRPPVFYDFLSLLETVTLTQRNRRTYTNSRCFFFNCSSRLFTRASVGKPESKNASKFVLVDKWGLIVPGFPSVERGICDRLALREQHNS